MSELKKFIAQVVLPDGYTEIILISHHTHPTRREALLHFINTETDYFGMLKYDDSFEGYVGGVVEVTDKDFQPLKLERPCETTENT